jgi:hypothetical protein
MLRAVVSLDVLLFDDDREQLSCAPASALLLAVLLLLLLTLLGALDRRYISDKVVMLMILL